MAGRHVILRTLREDPVLNGMGISSNHVLMNFGQEDIPHDRDHLFIMVRFGGETFSGSIGRGPFTVNVAVHQPLEMGRDLAVVDEAVSRIRTLLPSISQETGVDGTVTAVDLRGTGGDTFDPGYNTLTRDVIFDVLADQNRKEG